ncbi:MAG: hypothetical protein IT209_02695 [Armatimonadetes bacterium]|nr:hypothetical protein [Armatimonadota bacterium]
MPSEVLETVENRSRSGCGCRNGLLRCLVALFIMAAVGFGAFYWVVAQISRDLDRYSVRMTAPSPDGRFVASVVTHGFGASVSHKEVGVYLRPQEQEPVYQDRADYVLYGKRDDLTVRWASSETLVITLPPAGPRSEFTVYRTVWRKIKIKYVSRQ